MKRRDLLKSFALSMAAPALGFQTGQLYGASAGYEGKLLIVLQAEGGWDPTSFCDPKTNVAGERDITNWSNVADVQSAGKILFAPFADNVAFFNKYNKDMLVINGVDAQTNSHSTGVLHNWSGRNAAGFPTLTAMFAALNAPDVPLSYINYGGFANAERLIRYNRLDRVEPLLELLDPNKIIFDPQSTMRDPTEVSRIERYQQERLRRKLADVSMLPRNRFSAETYLQSRDTRASLDSFTSILPPLDSFESDVELGKIGTSSLRRQMQLTILAMKSGVASAADLYVSGFDTHSDHDNDHSNLLSHLTQSIDYLWTYANEQGIADRITLVVGSDFGRTPFYNDTNGKDHWPIGSNLIMEQGAGWGNRVVGITDGGHNAIKINPTTLQRDDTAGTIIYPKHVHKALRRHLNIENTLVDSKFMFDDTEDFDFFNSELSST
jgi:hypothetical protein